MAKKVHIDCTPTEFLLIVGALEHLSKVNPKDVEFAEKLAEKMNKLEVKELI